MWYDDITLTDVYVAPMPPPSGDVVFINEDFEGGTAGAAITVGGGGNTDFDGMTGTPIFDSAHCLGAFAAKFTTPGTPAPQYVTEIFASSANDSTLKFDLWMGALPPSNLTIATYNDGSNNVLAALRVASDGTVNIVNGSTSTGGSQVATTAVPVVAGQRAQIHWHVNSTPDLQEIRLFVGADIGGTVPTAHVSGTYDKGPTARCRVGLVASGVAGQTLWMDNVYIDNILVGVYTTPPTTTLVDENFEAGTNGAALSAVLTDFDTFFGTSGLREFSNAHAKGPGTLCAHFDTGSLNSLNSMKKTISPALDNKLYVRFYHWIDAWPTTDSSVARLYNAGSVVAGIRFDASQIFSLMNGASQSAVGSMHPLPGRWQRLEWTIDLVAGTQKLDTFTGANVDGTTPNETLNGAVIPQIADDLRFGTIFGTPASWVIYMDQIVASTAAMPAPITGSGTITTVRWVKGGVWSPITVHKL